MNHLFPLNIYLNRKNAKRQLYIYLVIMAGCIITFWFTSGKLFTENYYYPKATAIMGLLTPIMIVCVIIHIKEMNSKEPYIRLDNDGIKQRGKTFPLVRWNEIAGVSEQMFNGEKHLAISVKDIHAYIGRMPNGKRKNLVEKNVVKTNNNTALLIHLKMLDYNVDEFENMIKQTVADAKNETLA